MYTVCSEINGQRRDGRNYPALSTAERQAMARALTLPGNAKVLILGNTFQVEAQYPGQLPNDIITSTVKSAAKAASNRDRATRRAVLKKRQARKRNR